MIKVTWDSNAFRAEPSASKASRAATSSNVHEIQEVAVLPSALPPRAGRRRPPPPSPPVGVSVNHALSPVVDAPAAQLRRTPMKKWDMGTISEDTMPPAHAAPWADEDFELSEQGDVRNKRTGQRISKDEIRAHGERVLRGLIGHVHTRMLQELFYVEQAIPPLEFGDESDSGGASITSSSGSGYGSVRSSSSSICSTADGFRMMVDTDVPRCIFHTSPNFSVAEKLLVFVCSFRGLSCGIWSRSVLLKDGVQVGSMLPYFEAAARAGYGVLVMNPNMNTQLMMSPDSGEVEKMPIPGSSNADEHCDHVWNNYIFPSAAHKVHFIAYGYGGVLVTQLLDKYKHELRHRLGNVAFIESSHKVDPTWHPSFKRFFSEHCVAWARSSEPINSDLSTPSNGSDRGDGLANTMANMTILGVPDDGGVSPSSAMQRSPSAGMPSTIGCVCLSAGPCEGPSSSPAYTTTAVRDAVFSFLEAPNAYEYQRKAARELKLNAMLEAQDKEMAETDEEDMSPREREERQRRMMQRSTSNSRRRSTWEQPAKKPRARGYDALSIDDFDLMRVVGRGAFGKVMLVRKKNSSSRSVTDGKVYAMKVIKKNAVFARNQVEHTKTERRVLQQVDHPFLVKLRYAFQNEAKLYFVMDYYNGGTLHFHLRRAVHFDESRARFYAAQLVLALSHLHTYGVVYRDLKPENILMDDQGFIAITDFGLSHDRVDSDGALQTFCGTPEYIAPELIRRVPYGKAVDYWSLGVLLYEMLAGYTPFFHANRKRNFQNIVKLPLRFPQEFSDDARSLLRGLLSRRPEKRLGSGPYGAQEIMDHPFFGNIDWARLYRREVRVPFQPVVRKEGEVSNVPEFFKRQEVIDSVVSDAPIGKRNEFQGFSYTDPFQL